MCIRDSPGISLKSEGISYMAGADLPGVIVNVQRGGPGLGSIQPSQADYWQATKATGHGDFHIVVYAPSTVQEMADYAFKAFDTADKYRCLLYTSPRSSPRAGASPTAARGAAVPPS